jgi:hypothetical protein
MVGAGSIFLPHDRRSADAALATIPPRSDRLAVVAMACFVTAATYA